MGIFDWPVKILHFGLSGASRAGTSFIAFFTGGAAMRGIDLQFQSYEGREVFDEMQLSKYLKQYHRVKKKLEKYDKYFVENIYKKYSNRPNVLNAVLIYEIQIFKRYYDFLLDLITRIQLQESHLEIMNNAKILRDKEELTKLIQKLEESQDTTLPWDELLEVLKNIKKEMQKYESEEEYEFDERRRMVAGGTPVSGIIGWFGRRMGIHRLARALHKQTVRLFNYYRREENRNLALLQAEINEVGGNKVSPATVARLQMILKNYVKLRTYYHNIDKDITLILSNLFLGIKELIEHNIIPFYAAMKNVPGAKKIEEQTQIINLKYQDYKKELAQEEFEISKIKQELLNLINVCNNARTSIWNRNEQIEAALQRELKLKD